jgi:hypothetical protein
MDVFLLQKRRPGEASVENVGIKIGSIGPCHGAQLRIDPNLCEICGVSKWLEHAPKTEMGREIDHAIHAVLESKVQAVAVERLCGNNIL